MHIKHHNRLVIVLAQRESRLIHHLEVAGNTFLIGNSVKTRGRGISFGICGVNTIHGCSLHHHLSVDFTGTQRGSRIRAEERVSRARGEYDNLTVAKLLAGNIANVGFSHILHLNGAVNMAGNARFLHGRRLL